MYQHYPGFEELMREALRILLGEEVEKQVEMGLAKDGSGVGGKSSWPLNGPASTNCRPSCAGCSASNEEQEIVALEISKNNSTLHVRQIGQLIFGRVLIAFLYVLICSC